MSRTRIVFLPDTPGEPLQQLLVGPGGGVLERGVLTPLDAVEAASARCVLVVPGTDVTVRWLHTPTRNPRQARSAALLALEDDLAVPSLDAHVALGALEADGYRAAVVVTPLVLSGWIEAVRALGLVPDAAVPDCLALPEPEEGAPLNGAVIGGHVAVRGRRLAFAAEPDLLPLLLKDRPLLDMAPADVERAMAQVGATTPVNLLQGAFDPGLAQQLDWPALRRAVILAAVALISPLVIMAAQVVRQDLAARDLEAKATASVAAVSPAGAALDDPAGQAQLRLAQARLAAGAGPAAMAAQLFTAIESLERAQVESLIAMPDGTMRATVSYANYSDIDLLTKALGRSGVVLRQEGSRDEAGRVISDVILGARP